MLLSEAIEIGRLILKPEADILFNKERNSGCALGMALAGVALEPVASSPPLRALWPWLASVCVYPCSCKKRDGEIVGIIAHLFDFHVMGGLVQGPQDLPFRTLDGLLYWIRQHEPPETVEVAPVEEKQLVEV
jgi:hypothetical protein